MWSRSKPERHCCQGRCHRPRTLSSGAPRPGPSSTGLQPGQTVVLTPGGQGAAPAQGGTGKTQLAVEFARTLWDARAVEVLVWVTAASREAIITGFAHAASLVGVDDPDEGAEVTAARFLTWLAHTSRPWALIIDDLADPADLGDLWPWAGRPGCHHDTAARRHAEPGAREAEDRSGRGVQPPRGPVLPQLPAHRACRPADRALSTSARTSTACPSASPRRRP